MMNTTELVRKLHECSDNKPVVIITMDDNNIPTVNRIHTVIEYGDLIQIVIVKQ